MQQIPLMIITGPTATGKTAAAVELAQHLNGEVISADSMQIYRHFDIGTAKPTLSEMEGIPHHGLDVALPQDNFTVADYQTLARRKINDIHKNNKLPIIAGGTGFYIDAVIYQYDFSGFGYDQKFRDHWQQIAVKKGNLYLHQQLTQLDPPAAKQIHSNDLKRIIRALEINYLSDGKSSLAQPGNKKPYPGYDVLMIGLHYPREILYRRIEQRVDIMLSQGLVDEVKGLLDSGFDTHLTPMKGLGYKEIVGYLKGEYSLEEAVEQLKRNTRRFAKRQLTWFKRYSSIKWIDMEEEKTISSAVGKILTMYRASSLGVEKEK